MKRNHDIPNELIDAKTGVKLRDFFGYPPSIDEQLWLEVEPFADFDPRDYPDQQVPLSVVRPTVLYRCDGVLPIVRNDGRIYYRILLSIETDDLVGRAMDGAAS